MNFTIRPANAHDAKAIEFLSKEFADFLRSLGEPEAAYMSAEIFLRECCGPNPAFSGLVAEHEGGITGYLLYHPGYDTDYLTRTLHIIDLYVQASWRRYGIGRMLMEKAMGICRRIGGTQLFWSVYTKNEAALTFYERLGARFTKDLLFMRLDV